MKKLLLVLALLSLPGFGQTTPTPKVATKPITAAVSSSASTTGCTVAPCTITYTWTDSTDTAATYSIYYRQITSATSSSSCPAAPTSSPPAGYTELISGLAAGTTSYAQTGVQLATLTCTVVTATDPTSGLQSVPSNQASVFIPAVAPAGAPAANIITPAQSRCCQINSKNLMLVPARQGAHCGVQRGV